MAAPLEPGADSGLPVRERELPVQLDGAARREGDAAALEALPRSGPTRPWARSWARRTSQALHAGGQGAGARDGGEHPRRAPRSAGQARVDDRRDQDEGLRQARRHRQQDRLPRPLARLLGAPDRAGGVRHQREPRQRVRVPPRHGQDRQAGGPQRVADVAAHGERLLQPAGQRDRLPRGDHAAAVLRSDGGRRGQLRRHGRGDRARDHPRLRRPGPPVRRAGQPQRMVDAGGREGVQRARRRRAGAVRRLRRDRHHQGERQAHAGREHRRPGRAHHRLRRVSALARGPRAGEDRRTHRPPAVLPVMGPGMAGNVPAGVREAAGAG